MRQEAEEHGDLEDYLIRILARGMIQDASKEEMLLFLSQDIQQKSEDGGRE